MNDRRQTAEVDPRRRRGWLQIVTERCDRTVQESRRKQRTTRTAR